MHATTTLLCNGLYLADAFVVEALAVRPRQGGFFVQLDVVLVHLGVVVRKEVEKGVFCVRFLPFRGAFNQGLLGHPVEAQASLIGALFPRFLPSA